MVSSIHPIPILIRLFYSHFNKIVSHTIDYDNDHDGVVDDDDDWVEIKLKKCPPSILVNQDFHQ